MRKIYLLLLVLSINAAFPQAGELDPNFATDGFFISNDENLDTGDGMAVLADNKIIMIGGHDNFTCVKLSANGVLDTSFGTDGKVFINFTDYYAEATDIAIQPDGKIILAGNTFVSGGNYYFTVVRLNADGSLDTTFNGTGKLVFDFFGETINYCYAVSLQADGKIILAGQTGIYANADFAVACINPDGTFDSTFGSNGKQRYNLQLDDRGKCMAIQPDGKIIVCGYSYPSGSNYCAYAAIRITTTGDLDTSFSGDGKVITKVASNFGNDTVQDMALQGDGKILILADSYIGGQVISAIRLTTAGELDTSFSGDGKFTATMGATNYPSGIIVQPDGNIVVAGTYYYAAVSGQAISVLRLTSAGELDTTFSVDGKASFLAPNGNGPHVYDTKLQSTGQILVSGYSGNNYMMARVFSGNELANTEFNDRLVNFYPNPARQTLNFTEDISEAAIFSLDGKLLIAQKNTFGQMDVSHLQEGIYLIKTKTTDSRISQQKLAIKR